MNMNEEDLRRMNKVLRHRLRNFATGIKSSVSLLAHVSDGKLPDGDMEYFPLISNECDDVKLLTERMNLLFDALPAQDSECVPCSRVPAILEQFAADFLRKQPTACLVLETGDASEGVIPVSEKALVTALNEMTMNAWESDRMGDILLECTASEGNMTFRVLDNGGGVKEDDMEEIFLPFFTTRSKHIGIGLTIANRVIANAGGSMAVENITSGGLKVEMSLPLQEEL